MRPLFCTTDSGGAGERFVQNDGAGRLVRHASTSEAPLHLDNLIMASRGSNKANPTKFDFFSQPPAKPNPSCIFPGSNAV